MNLLDGMCVLLAIAAGIGGYRLGFIRRVLGWIGMVGGLLLALWLLPSILGTSGPADNLAATAPRRLIISAIALCIGAIIGQALGALAGLQLRKALERFPVRRADAGLGAVAGVVGLVATLWILLPTMGQVPGWPAREARSSWIARSIDRSMPDPPGLLDNLGRVVGVHGLPRVFENLQLTPDVAPPPANSPVQGDALRRASSATFKVLGEACGQVQSGTGFVVEPGLLVTNAHVVAGTDAIEVERIDGARFSGEVVAFDSQRDLALISAPSVRVEPLPMGTTKEGDVGVALGFPGGGSFTIANYRVGRRLTALGRDIYNERLVERSMYVLGAQLERGDSGGPMVDPTGTAVGVVFAIAPDDPQVAYAITIDQVTRMLDAPHADEVGTGPCTA